jgi:predicted lysophospholipase L1 biosynthesis ABC-type transport system permease subunit
MELKDTDRILNRIDRLVTRLTFSILVAAVVKGIAGIAKLHLRLHIF